MNSDRIFTFLAICTCCFSKLIIDMKIEFVAFSWVKVASARGDQQQQQVQQQQTGLVNCICSCLCLCVCVACNTFSWNESKISIRRQLPKVASDSSMHSSKET